VPLSEVDAPAMMVLAMRFASYWSARGIREIDPKERKMMDTFEMVGFAVLCLAFEVILVTGLCPIH
jgi:hypothetical protein